MCKHVLNAQVALFQRGDPSQVSIRTPCCQKWFDCPQCHNESEDHVIAKTTEMTFACKKCKKVFRKDMQLFEESDEYCPRCDNHFIIDAETPETKAIREGKGTMVIGVDDGHEMGDASDTMKSL